MYIRTAVTLLPQLLRQKDKTKCFCDLVLSVSAKLLVEK